MKTPPGLSINDKRIVCKLKKSIYGLKQAPIQWYSKLSYALHYKGYQRSKNDYSLFFNKTNKTVIFLAIYVDDILMTWNNLEGMNELKSYIDQQFKIKDLGYLLYFLGIEAIQKDEDIILTQRKFTLDLLVEFNCHSLNSTASPLVPGQTLTNDMGEPYKDPTSYRKLIGKLNYFTNTRPDLVFSVQYLS